VGSNYERIAGDNLTKLYENLPENLEERLGGFREGDDFIFRAFGEDCTLGRNHILLGAKTLEDPRAVLISLYALHCGLDQIQVEPFKSFKDFPNSMPYQAAFSAHSERVLIPQVNMIKNNYESITSALDGRAGSSEMGGDFSFILFPLPKIALAYVFYMADEEFPAAVTCLFSANALSFMPLDGLADVAEYTSKKIIAFVSSGMK
jgi:hypothetical protein